MAVQGLCNKYAANVRRKPNKGNPVCKLAVGSFNSKKFGRTPRPDFPILRWENDGSADATPPPVSVELDDEIPFTT